VTVATEISASSTSRFADIEGIKVHFHDTGMTDERAEGRPPLVLLHGGGPGASGWSNFAQNVPDLARHFRVLVVDQVGYGQTDKHVPECGVWTYSARILAGLLESLGIEKANFAGNSLGGGASLRLALDFPDRVNRLVLMGPAGSISPSAPVPTEGMKVLYGFYAGSGPSIQKMQRLVDVMVHRRDLVPPGVVEERFRAATEPDAVEYGRWFFRVDKREGFSPHLDELWREVDRIQHKTLIVWGRDDRVVPVDGGLFLARRMQDARLHVIPRCGHWAQLEHSTEFNRLTTSFLTGP